MASIRQIITKEENRLLEELETTVRISKMTRAEVLTANPTLAGRIYQMDRIITMLDEEKPMFWD
jgi:hypothetical protein